MRRSLGKENLPPRARYINKILIYLNKEMDPLKQRSIVNKPIVVGVSKGTVDTTFCKNDVSFIFINTIPTHTSHLQHVRNSVLLNAHLFVSLCLCLRSRTFAANNLTVNLRHKTSFQGFAVELQHHH